MPIHDIYSKRTKRAASSSDVFAYDPIPATLRHQILIILREFFSDLYGYEGMESEIRKILEREYGRELPEDEFSLTSSAFSKLVSEGSTDEVLDAIELSLKWIDHARTTKDREFLGAAEKASELLNELNFRFREAGLGFQFEQSQVFRIDSTLVHVEAVKPALLLLSDQRFAAAAAEFLSAFDHYRRGEFEASLIEACKSFESVLKVICDEKGWAYDSQRATAKNLINVVITNNLLPSWSQEHLMGLQKTLEAGVPTVRNKLAGHGDGSRFVPVEIHFVAYALHLTACNILLLAEAFKAASS